jgi:hypothetical protein
MANLDYRAWLRRELGSIVDDLDLDELQKRFMHSRWLDQVIWVEGKAKANQQRYYLLRVVTIAGGVIVPALVSLNIANKHIHDAVAWVTFGVSLVVALGAALEGFFRYGDRWRNFRRLAEALKTQGWQFFQLSGPYANFPDHKAAYPTFAAQVEANITQDVELYITQIVQELRKSQAGASQAGGSGA